MSCILNIENENELTAAKLELIAFREEEGIEIQEEHRRKKNISETSEKRYIWFRSINTLVIILSTVDKLKMFLAISK
jgi:hypothetical protein